MSVDSIIEVF